MFPLYYRFTSGASRITTICCFLHDECEPAPVSLCLHPDATHQAAESTLLLANGGEHTKTNAAAVFCSWLLFSRVNRCSAGLSTHTPAPICHAAPYIGVARTRHTTRVIAVGRLLVLIAITRFFQTRGAAVDATYHVVVLTFGLRDKYRSKRKSLHIAFYSAQLVLIINVPPQQALDFPPEPYGLAQAELATSEDPQQPGPPTICR